MKKLIIVASIFLTISGCAAPENTAPTQEQIAPAIPAPTILEPVPESLRLTIPEGATLPAIAVAIEEIRAGSALEFIEAAQAGNFSEFSLIYAAPTTSSRFFALEGYLFPGNYYIYPNEPPDSIIRRILSATESEIDSSLRNAISNSGNTIDEIIIMASIIQKESLGNEAVMPLVSSVIHNRISTGMMLQMCKTSFYIRDHIDPFYSGDSSRFHNYYNTYMFHGLPIGPICNPGLGAIRASLSPADTNYFFYIWDDNDVLHFASTWEEHQANVRKYLL